MTGDSGPRAAAQVHAQVIAFRFVVGGKRRGDTLGQLHHLGERIGVAVRQLALMSKRDDHDVTGCIGEAIEDDEILPTAMHDQAFRVVAHGQGVAEDAAIVFGGIGDVAVAPGSPEVIHGQSIVKISELRVDSFSVFYLTIR